MFAIVSERHSEILPGEQRSSSSKNRYVTGIDGLRAVAVLSVLLYHVDARLVPGGFVGVDLFFVISGYVVSMSTSGTRVQDLRHLVLSFYRRRVVRILPAALIFLLTTQLAAILFVPILDHLTVPDMTAAAATGGFSNVVLWLMADDYFSPGTALNPFTHTWSLAVEEQFYILFPFFALPIWVWRDHKRLGKIAVAVCAMASLIIAAYLTPTHHSFAFYMLPARFWELAVGVLLFAMTQNAAKPPQWLVAVLSGFGAVLLVATLWLTTQNDFPFPNAIAAVLAAVVLIYVVSISSESYVPRVLSLPVLRYVGRISYSLYLWHWGVIVLMLWTVGLETPLQKIAAIVISIALADASYRFVERPVRGSAWLARWPDWRVVVTGIAGIGFAGVLIVGLTAFRPMLTLSVTGDLATWSPSEQGNGGGNCEAARSRDVNGISTRYEFEPKSCHGATDTRHLYVVGDSHAWAYQRLVGNIVRTEGMGTTIYMSAGCNVEPDLETLEAAPQCATYVENSLAAVLRVAKSGDILFLPGLRIQRYRELWEIEQEPHGQPKIYTDAMLTVEAARFKPFADRGVRVILEAPKPVYKFAPVRCSDWFNRSNPICQDTLITADELQERRSHIIDMFARLSQLEPRIEIFDPFPLLCPGKTCPAMVGDKPLSRDGDHLSGYANDFLTPFFLNVLNNR